MLHRIIGMLAITVLCATSAISAPLKLKPADPQPGALKNGLAVSYAYATDGQHIKSLDDAMFWLKSGTEPGPPLKGLDYRDTNEGQKTLTSKQAFNVAARIKGFVRFDKPGVYTIEFLTNDGLNMSIGGQVVGYLDGRQPCEGTRRVDVDVPSAGWYPLSGIYFQRLGTSCLHMRWAPSGGKMKWVPDSVFGH